MEMRAYFLNRIMGYGLGIVGLASCGDDLSRQSYRTLDAMVAEVGGEVKGYETRGYDGAKKDSFRVDTTAKDSTPDAVDMPALPTGVTVDPDEPIIPKTEMEGAIYLTGCDNSKWQDGKTYVMDKDLVLDYTIVFDINQKKDITIDCQRHSIKPTVKGKGVGIVLNSSTNITIKNCIIEDFESGIVFLSSQAVKVVYNNLQSNVKGAEVLWNGGSTGASDDIYFFGNLVERGEVGIQVTNANRTIIKENIFDSLSDDAIIIYNLKSDTKSYILNNSITGPSLHGITTLDSPNTVVKDNYVSGVTFGITISKSVFNVVTSNTVTGAMYGLMVNSSSAAIVANNKVCASLDTDVICYLASEKPYNLAAPHTLLSTGNKFATVDGCEEYGTTGSTPPMILWPVQGVHYQECGKK